MPHRPRRRDCLIALGGPALLQACAVVPVPREDGALLAWIDRLSFGLSADTLARVEREGASHWVDRQLQPRAVPAALPAQAQARIDAFTISQAGGATLALQLDAQRAAFADLPDELARTAARQAYQRGMDRAAREAQLRFVLRALYAPDQLQELMAWFWCNHFHVSMRKGPVRPLLADFEDQAIRPHALGRFRDMLGAVVRHPAMLLYLDNQQNAAGRLNENLARELLELHTLGVDGGYTQADVQEMARVLTGVGIALRPADAPPPRLAPALASQYLRVGAFEFNPARHDRGPKTLLGEPLQASGLAGLDEALDRLCGAPATARFIARKLAVYFVADEPPPALVDRLAERFRRTDGDIAAVLRTLLSAPEFSASLGHKFRDPLHYVLASVRLAYGDRVVQDLGPLLAWLSRLGEAPWGRETPDGYPLTQDAWASAGQMGARFEIARTLGTNGAVLFRSGPGAPLEQPPYPPLARQPAVQRLQASLRPATREILAQAGSPQDWNTYLLAAPERMYR